MANPAGESNAEVLSLDFNRRLMLQFRGSVITSDAGLLERRARPYHDGRRYTRRGADCMIACLDAQKQARVAPLQPLGVVAGKRTDVVDYVWGGVDRPSCSGPRRRRLRGPLQQLVAPIWRSRYAAGRAAQTLYGVPTGTKPASCGF
jgi:hypothetical protein